MMLVITFALLALSAATARTIGQFPLSMCTKCTCSATSLDCTMQNLNELPLSDEEAWPEDVQDADLGLCFLDHLQRLPSLPLLRRLSFRLDMIRSVDDGAFIHLPQLQILDLGFNELSSLELKPSSLEDSLDMDDVQPLVNLLILKLDYNNFKSLQSDFFEYAPNLVKLTIAGNPLDGIDNSTLLALCSLVHLKSLDLSSVGLRELPEELLTSLVDLVFLDLSTNKLTSVPQSLNKAYKLKELHLSSNPIMTLEMGAFPPALTSLQALHMERMSNLTRVGRMSLSVLTGLHTLVLADSPMLTEIDPEAFARFNSSNSAYPVLLKLVLRRNGLYTLHPGLLPLWNQLLILDLRHNPWTCDCDLAWSTLFVPVLMRQSAELKLLFCSRPISMAGQLLFSEMTLQYYQTNCGLKAGGPAASGPSRDSRPVINVHLSSDISSEGSGFSGAQIGWSVGGVVILILLAVLFLIFGNHD